MVDLIDHASEEINELKAQNIALQEKLIKHNDELPKFNEMLQSIIEQKENESNSIVFTKQYVNFMNINKNNGLWIGRTSIFMI